MTDDVRKIVADADVKKQQEIALFASRINENINRMLKRILEINAASGVSDTYKASLYVSDDSYNGNKIVAQSIFVNRLRGEGVQIEFNPIWEFFKYRSYSSRPGIDTTFANQLSFDGAVEWYKKLLIEAMSGLR